MQNISSFRDKYPQYSDISDEQLTKSLHQKHYQDLDFDKFSRDFLGTQEDKGGMSAAFGAGVDKVQELGYRAVKGFTDVGVPEDKQTNAVGRAIGQDGALSQWAQEGIDRNIEEQKDYEPTVNSYKDVDSISDAGSYVGEMVAGSLPYMAGAMTGAGAAAMAGGLSEEAYDKQPEEEKNAARAVASGVGQMALERLGIKGSMGQIGKDILKDGVFKTAQRYGKGELVDAVKDPSVARRLLKGATWEGMTETGQEALAQWGAGASLDQIHGLDEAFVGGFVVGGAIRSGTESAQRVMSWQEKSSPIAKNGIEALVEQGMPQEQAIEHVRVQLMEAATKQGFSESDAAAAVARTMKLDYGIDHEIFTPVANDVAEQRRIWGEQRDQQMQGNRQRSEQMRVKYETQGLDDALGGDTAPTVDDLLGDAGNVQGPLPSEQVEVSNVEDAPLSVSERRELMNLRLEKQRVEGGVGSIQEKLSENSAPTATDLIGEAGYVQGPVPSEQHAKVQNETIDPFYTGQQKAVEPAPETGLDNYQYEGELLPVENYQGRSEVTGLLDSPVIEGEVTPGIEQKDVVFAQDRTGELDAQEKANQIDNAQRAQFERVNKRPKQITDKDIIFADDQSADTTINVRANGTPFKNERLLKISKNYKAAIANGEDIDIIDIPKKGHVAAGVGWRSNYADEILSTKTVGNQLEPGEKQEIAAVIDEATKEAALSPDNNLPEPSQAQKDAGNYKMSHVKVNGLNITIENPKGSQRSGIDTDGKSWSVKMNQHYGYIKGTEGADGDHVDVFIGDKADADNVYVVDQIDPQTGKFDEHKVMMSFGTETEAKEAYLSNYTKDWQGIGAISAMPIDKFKQWTKSNKTKKPLRYKEPVSKKPKVDMPDPKSVKIEDFGEVLGGAAKHTYAFNEAISGDVDVSALPLSKSFPQPDYEKLAADNVDARALAWVAQVRGEIKNKPRQSYKLSRWVESVDFARSFASQLLAGDRSIEQLIEKMKVSKGGSSYLKYLPHILDIAKDIPAANIKELGLFKLTHAHYSVFHGESDVYKWVVTNSKQGGGYGGMGNMSHFDTVEQATAYIKEQVTKAVSDNKVAKFDIWTERGRKGITFVGKKLAAGKFIELKQFSSTSEARSYINDNNAELVELLKNKKEVRAVRRASNNPRIGIDHREGVEVTPELFDKIFGFRGVQFGNWVEGGKRQDDLNNAFDGLMDLANLLEIPPKAISLNGELGMAFGARGRPGAAAHFEPDNIVINLTKKQGAGSLAHEWFHALDNYFARMDKLDSGNPKKGAFITAHDRKLGVYKDGAWTRATAEDFDVRQQVYDAFKAITKTIASETKMVERSIKLDTKRSKNYWATALEMSARSFERYVIDKLAKQGYESDYLANIVSEEALAVENKLFGDDQPYAYPLAIEMDVVNKAYDGLFNTLQTKETDKGLALFSRTSDSDRLAVDNMNRTTITKAHVNEVLREIVAGWSGNRDLRLDEFVVVDSFDALPDAIKNAAHDQDAQYAIQGVNYHGKSYIVLDKMTSKLDVEETIFHETYGHYGIRKLFGKELEQKLNQLLVGIGGVKGLDRVAKKYKIDLSEYKAGHEKSSLTNAQAQTVLMDELLAHLAQNNRPSVMRTVKEIIGYIRQTLKKLGFKRLKGISDAELFYVLKQARNAVKSNSGDGVNSDIRFSRTSAASETAQLQNNIADETKTDYRLRRIQDKFQRLLVIQRSLAVNEDNDAYMAEEAFHGKVSEDLRKLELERTDKIANTMAKHELSQDEVDLYLIAKHAKERNAYIDTINPELKGAGSGMSNEQAQSILDKAIFEEKYQALEEISSQVYSMLGKNREMMVEFGLEAQDAIDNWQSQYKFYVPLKGYAKDEDSHAKDDKGKQTTRYGTGKGFNIKGRETIKAMGRRSLAESPLLHSIQDTTQGIIRARKNEVGNAFLKLVNENPDSELWQVFTAKKPDMMQGEITKDGKTTIGPVKMTAMAMKSSDDYFKVKVDGVENFIKIKDVVLKDTMANLGVDEMGAFVRNVGKVTRTLSALVTTWNPEFMLTNFTRDIQAAVANVLAETQVADGKALNTEKLAAKMVKSMPRAMTVLRQGFRNNKFDGSGKFSDPKWGGYLKEFLESGAKTGWVNQKDVKELASELKSSISRASNTKVGKAHRFGKNVADFVSDYNDIVENSARFSVYYHAREQGISVKQASSLAKNLTINFNRKGEMGATMNALYMFSNASVQGTANMLRALATPKDRSKSMWNPEFYNLSQKLAIGSVFGTMAMAQVMREMGGDDEDGVAFYDKVPDYVKATNFVIMTGGKDYIAIPMPYGYNFLAGLGHSLDGLRQGESAGKQATKIALSVVGTFSPLGLTESENTAVSLVKMAAPTVVKPFVEMAVDEKFTGGNIYPDQRGYNVKKADANRGDSRTWEWSKNFTSWLNEFTRGTEYKSGGIDIAPQSIDHMVKFMGGGVLQFGLRWQNLAAKAMVGKEIESRDIPFWRRFHKQLNPKQTIGEFYDAKESLAAYKADLNYMRGSDRAQYLSKYRNHLTLNAYASGIDKQLRALNKRKRGIEAGSLPGSEKELRLQRIDDLKIEHTMRFAKKRYQLGIQYL